MEKEEEELGLALPKRREFTLARLILFRSYERRNNLLLTLEVKKGQHRGIK